MYRQMVDLKAHVKRTASNGQVICMIDDANEKLCILLSPVGRTPVPGCLEFSSLRFCNPDFTTHQLAEGYPFPNPAPNTGHRSTP